MPRGPAGGLPRYVEACRSGTWYLRLLRLSTGEVTEVPYRCRSWRCEGKCRRSRANADGTRIRKAMEAHGGPFVYLVLTTDPADYLPGWVRRPAAVRNTPPTPPPAAWTDLHRKWTLLWKRIRRRWGLTRPGRGGRRVVTRHGADQYVSVVESTRAGWPHLNVVIAGGPFVAAAQGEGIADLEEELRAMAVECGFGEQLYAEEVRYLEKLPQYIAKLAGEASKASQVPIAAPRGFRRLRSTRGFLPPREKDADLTGVLMDAETNCAVNQAALATFYRTWARVLLLRREREGADALLEASTRRREARRRIVERFLEGVYGLAAPPPAAAVA